jgi:hypothetical protein
MPHPETTRPRRFQMTSNGFDFFEGSRTESKTPQVTVRRSGQMVLTPPAVAMLGDEVSHVQFGYDSKTQAVALRAAPKGAKGRYRLRSQTNGSSLVDGRRFLAHHGVQVEKAQSYPAEVFGEGIVGFRFDGAGSDAPDAEDETPAKVDTPTVTRKPVRTAKRKAVVATA